MVRMCLDFRGHWCPFCRSYIEQLQSLLPSITSFSSNPSSNRSKGTCLLVTAEDPIHMTELRQMTKYTGPSLNDTENILANELWKRGLIDVAITPRDGYPHDMAQPAVLFMKGKEVQESWAIVPSTVSPLSSRRSL